MRGAGAGTAGAGEGAPRPGGGVALGVEGVLGVLGGPLPLSWEAILAPATHSVSRFLARSRMTLALMWKAPEDTPSWMHCAVMDTFPSIRILWPQ